MVKEERAGGAKSEEERAGGARPGGTDYYEDFGREAGDRGRHPLGEADAEAADPNQAAADDHELEGEGYRERGRRAAGDPGPDDTGGGAAAGRAAPGA